MSRYVRKIFERIFSFLVSRYLAFDQHIDCDKLIDKRSVTCKKADFSDNFSKNKFFNFRKVKKQCKRIRGLKRGLSKRVRGNAVMAFDFLLKYFLLNFFLICVTN